MTALDDLKILLRRARVELKRPRHPQTIALGPGHLFDIDRLLADAEQLAARVETDRVVGPALVACPPDIMVERRSMTGETRTEAFKDYRAILWALCKAASAAKQWPLSEDDRRTLGGNLRVVLPHDMFLQVQHQLANPRSDKTIAQWVLDSMPEIDAIYSTQGQLQARPFRRPE